LVSSKCARFGQLFGIIIAEGQKQRRHIAFHKDDDVLAHEITTMAELTFPRLRPRRLLWGPLAVWLAIGLALPAFGQARPSLKRPPPPDQPTTLPANLEGTVVEIKSGEIVISAHLPAEKDAKEKPEDTVWTVTTPPKISIRVVGEAKPDYLKPGLTVQFTATVEEGEAGEKTVDVKEKIKELTIINPARGASRGTTPARKPAKKADGEGPAPKGPEPLPVVGRLGPMHEHKWPVRVGAKTLQIQLADHAKIHVDMTGPPARHLIGPGDKIVVEGQMIRNHPGPCMATGIHVTLSHPLTGPKSKRAGGKKEPGPKPGDSDRDGKQKK
jgi:hypothetical protein